VPASRPDKTPKTGADRPDPDPAVDHPGKRWGLPAEGRGSVSSLGTRAVAFLIDIALSFFVAWLFTSPELPRNWSLLVWAAMTVLAVGLFGFTPGQGIVGIRVAPVDGRAMVGLWAVPRTVLTFLVIPAVWLDEDGRGLHDKLCRTIVVRMR
jgi:uncharacterized RDD family membrane protein YckC